MNENNNTELFKNNSERKEKYRSCHDLENGIILFSDGVKHCCGLNKLGEKQKLISYGENMESTIREVLEQKKSIIQDNLCGKKTMCTSCNRLQEGEWFHEKKIRQVNFSLDYVCNLKCQYCDKWKKNYTNKKQRDIPKIMKELEECEQVEMLYPILYSSGEISILNKRNEILKSLNKYNTCIFSNATKYQNAILEKLLNSFSCLVVSLDCGTRETYKKIKGVDLFEVVCNNIKMYSEKGAQVVLKYIVMENNINKEDSDGFFQICQESRIDNVIISKDFYQKENIEELKKTTIKLIHSALRRDINVYIDGVYDIFEKIYNMHF